MWFLKYKLIDNNLIQSARIKFIESLVEEKSNDSQSTKKKKKLYMAILKLLSKTKTMRI